MNVVKRISPHPDAPLFASESDPVKVVDELMTNLDSGHFSGEEFRQYCRQAGLVSLWFFTKYIAGYSGPFDLINDGLHVEMANFFQDSMRPGLKSAAFTGRGLFKSTIFTRSGLGWDIMRFPDRRWLLFSAVHERSVNTFMHVTQRIFDENEFFAWLYPERVPEKNSRRWNNEEMVVPGRTRNYAEPSILPRGVGCSIQGLHGNVFIDDPVGDEQLDSMHRTGDEMKRIDNWLRTNIRTLLTGVVDPIVFYTATRYAVDDAHSFIFEKLASVSGDWDSDDTIRSPIKDDGEWRLYNKKTLVDGKSVCEENISTKTLLTILHDDPWTFYTQYQNAPYESGLTELNVYELHQCELDFDAKEGFSVSWVRSGDFVRRPLASMDTVQACDPAATEGYVSSRESRTAVVVLTRDFDDNRCILTVNADYVKPSTTFDWLFSNAKKFNGYLRKTVLEAQGAFKIMKHALDEEVQRRMKAAWEGRRNGAVFYPINHQPVTKTGEKIAVIRNELEPLLRQGKLFATAECRTKVLEELNVFPSGKKMDILDAIVLASKATFRPDGPREAAARERERERQEERVTNRAGY